MKAGPIFVVKLVTSFDNRDLHLGAIGEIDALVHDDAPFATWARRVSVTMVMIPPGASSAAQR